ncbi:MAG TPA: hypothetical protein VH498_00185 [Candidatus Dormibacteraeota bacterium]|nr:hypothetical protein [Candidatus Dormibacteraeota bacterium]
MPPSLPDLAPLAGLLVLLELAVGTVAVSASLDQVGRVGRGFAGTTAAICALIMGIDLLLLSAVSDLGALLHARIDAGVIAGLVHWCVAFTVLLIVDALFAAVGTETSRRVVELATVTVGLAALVAAAEAIGPAIGGVGGAVLVFLPAALIGGTALAGMLLGHWYLVTPNLSFRPLRLAIYAVFGAVLVDCAVIAYGLASHGDGRARLVSGDQAVLFWLLVVGTGVLFTAGVSAFTLYFARIRANQPATAMLYVLIISVVMGMVPTHLLFLVTGVPL